MKTFTSAVFFAVSALANMYASMTYQPFCPSGPVPASPPPPSQDTFYTPPSGWQSAAKGAILKHRDAPAFSYRANCNGALNTAATQLLYRTTDSSGNPAVGVVTVLTPNTIAGNNSSRLVMYSPPYDSSALDCSPSYQWSLQNSTNLGEPEFEINFESNVIQYGMNLGYYTAVVDYETTKAEFTVGLTSGQALLDATIAVLASTAYTNVSSSASVALTGYSGGSLATEWAAELQSTYAPSLTKNIVAISAGGLPANVSIVFDLVNNGNFSGIIPRGTVGAATSNATLAAFLNSSLVTDPTLRAKFYSVLQCNTTPDLDNQDIEKTYFRDFNTFLSSPTVQGYIDAQGIMGRHGIPKQPIYFFQGCADEVVGPTSAINLVNQYCATGDVTLTFQTYSGSKHAQAATQGYGLGINLQPQPGPAYQFIIDRFNGKAIAKGCVINNQC